MPATGDGLNLPPEAVTVARRYHRVERLVSGAVAIMAGVVVAAFLLRLPLPRAVVASVVVLGAVGIPAFRASGTVRLATDADPGSVRADFDDGAPPPLALHWGIADAVRRTEAGGVYEVSYLFGLRSTTMRTEVRSRSTDGGDCAGVLELVVTADGRPWGTYVVRVGGRDGRTTLDVEVTSDRRFGLRRLPQWLIAERYRGNALAAQGYAVVERDVGLSI